MKIIVQMRMTNSNIWTRKTGWHLAKLTNTSHNTPQEAQILLTGLPMLDLLNPRECPLWIKASQDKANNNPASQPTCQISPVDVLTLSYKQLLAYNIVSRHYRKMLNNEEQSPLHMIICGTAGTRKSYLINAIAHICGSTVHSAIKLPVHQSSHRDLQGPALQQLQHQLNNKHHIIINERSMIGQKMLAWIDKRLRQASGQLSQQFGGYSVIQLSPVCDRPLYATHSCNTNSPITLHGHTVYQMFAKVVVLHQIFCQSGFTCTKIQRYPIKNQGWHHQC